MSPPWVQSTRGLDLGRLQLDHTDRKITLDPRSGLFTEWLFWRGCFDFPVFPDLRAGTLPTEKKEGRNVLLGRRTGRRLHGDRSVFLDTPEVWLSVGGKWDKPKSSIGENTVVPAASSVPKENGERQQETS